MKTAIEDAVTGAGIDGVRACSQDIAQTVPSILGPGEVAGVLVAAFVVVAVLGTMLGAALPLAARCSGSASRHRVRCRSRGSSTSSR